MLRFVICVGALLVILCSSGAPVHASSMQKLNLYFNERAPYLEYKGNGRVEGLTASPANRALELANIPYVWKKASAEQQLAVINRNQEQACLVGWFKRPERERVGKFSSPLYAGKQMLALGLMSNPRLLDKMRIADLMRNPELVMLVKEGYSYGQILDQQIHNYSPKTIAATGENTNMLSMLLYKRADYFLVSEEEANALIQGSGKHSAEFKVTYFTEAIKEDSRYFWCTKQVPDSVMTKLNRVLEKSFAVKHRRGNEYSR